MGRGCFNLRQVIRKERKVINKVIRGCQSPAPPQGTRSGGANKEQVLRQRAVPYLGNDLGSMKNIP